MLRQLRGASHIGLNSVHSCDPFEDPPRKVDYEMKLYACSGFLLVTATNNEPGGFQHKLAWLYDVHESKWEAISDISESKSSFIEGEMTMFELQWDAVP